MAQEEVLKQPSTEGERGEQATEIVDEAELPELTDADSEQIVDETVQAAETTLVEAPGEARTVAVEHLGGDTSQIQTARTGYHQRMGDIRTWLQQKVRGAERAVFEQPVDTYVPSTANETQPNEPKPIEYRPEPAVTFPSVDGVSPPLPAEPAVTFASDMPLPAEPIIDEATIRASVTEDDLGPTGPEVTTLKGTLPSEPTLEKGVRSLRDEVADIIRDDPEEFDRLTDTVKDTRTPEQLAERSTAEKIAEIELKQAALIYELNDLAGYIPELAEVRDQAIPNLEWAREVINNGVPNTSEGAPVGAVQYPDLFTPEQLAQALQNSAELQVVEGKNFFGGTYEEWIQQGVGATAKKAAAEQVKPLVTALGEDQASTTLKKELWKGFTTLGLSQAWRLGKLAVGTPVSTVSNTLKTTWVLGSRFGSATLEKMRRSTLGQESEYPNVVKTADLLSRGADTQRKLDRIMQIQQKLHALSRERATLKKADKVGTMEQLPYETPATDQEAVEQMVYKTLWQNVVDQGMDQGKDAAVDRLRQDRRSVEELFLEDSGTGNLTMNDAELPVSFKGEEVAQMMERSRIILGNRSAIRAVCRQYLGTELQRAEHGLSKAGLQALQRGKFLFEPRVDGSFEVELLLEPTVQRRQSEYDEGGYEATDSGSSLHMTIPADMVERLLSEAATGNYQTVTNKKTGKPEQTRLLNDEALNRIFEGDIAEPTANPELGQSMQTEKSLLYIKNTLKEIGTMLQTFAANPSEDSALMLQKMYDGIHEQYQPDQLGEVMLSDTEQMQHYEQFVINLPKAKEIIQAVLAAKQAGDSEQLAQSIVALGDFYQTRNQEFDHWNTSFSHERTLQLKAKFAALAEQVKHKICRYPEKSTVTLPGRMMGLKDPITWTVVEARNGVYLLEQNGKQMVMPENDLANWAAIANKQAKAAKRTAQPQPFRMPKAEAA